MTLPASLIRPSDDSSLSTFDIQLIVLVNEVRTLEKVVSNGVLSTGCMDIATKFKIITEIINSRGRGSIEFS